ncbi:hypothetical protein Ddye_027160 [Dipteronia dyeriana]|uniref:Uncharacterized protein n=1 Tax=Dipteronia dyeriana TaxID=168575 RepID=A0AAD9TNK5_9ROSI|nr:hypothetical protein Ddye_027160 [Dipteronia dyeriana]
MWNVHCRLEKIVSPACTSTGEGSAHSPCIKVRVTVDGHAFESPDFFKSRKAAEHAPVNVALMSFPFDGFQETPVWEGSWGTRSYSNVGRLTGTRIYLLYNRITVYACIPDISFPKGITLLQISKIGGWL